MRTADLGAGAASVNDSGDHEWKDGKQDAEDETGNGFAIRSGFGRLRRCGGDGSRRNENGIFALDPERERFRCEGNGSTNDSFRGKIRAMCRSFAGRPGRIRIARKIRRWVRGRQLRGGGPEVEISGWCFVRAANLRRTLCKSGRMKPAFAILHFEQNIGTSTLLKREYSRVVSDYGKGLSR